MLREIVEGNREQLKTAYLSRSYTIKDVEDKMKKAKRGVKAYIQWKCSQSRGGVCGGDVIEIDKGKAVVYDKFSPDMKTVAIDPKDIIMLDLVK